MLALLSECFLQRLKARSSSLLLAEGVLGTLAPGQKTAGAKEEPEPESAPTARTGRTSKDSKKERGRIYGAPPRSLSRHNLPTTWNRTAHRIAAPSHTHTPTHTHTHPYPRTHARTRSHAPAEQRSSSSSRGARSARAALLRVSALSSPCPYFRVPPAITISADHLEDTHSACHLTTSIQHRARPAKKQPPVGPAVLHEPRSPHRSQGTPGQSLDTRDPPPASPLFFSSLDLREQSSSLLALDPTG